MSYVDMQYTGPEWNNQTPPPLNATNLLDISHALEAVNITQQQRTSLSVGSTDVLGQILEALKTATDDEMSSIQQILSTKGNCNYYMGQYVGNGQLSHMVTLEVEPKLYFASYTIINTPYMMVYVGGSNYATTIADSYCNRVNASVSGTKLKLDGSAENTLNEKGRTVTYIVLG